MSSCAMMLNTLNSSSLSDLWLFTYLGMYFSFMHYNSSSLSFWVFPIYLLILLFCTTKTIMLSLKGRAFGVLADSAGNTCASWGKHGLHGYPFSGLVDCLWSIFENLPWPWEISWWRLNDGLLFGIRIIEHIWKFIQPSESPSASLKFRSTVLSSLFVPNIVNVEYPTLLLWLFLGLL